MMQSKLVLLSLALTGVMFAHAHSWAACADYEGSKTSYDEGACKGYPRDWIGRFNRGPPGSFGNDRGFDYRPNPAGRACHAPKLGAQDYANFPKATYTVGETVTVAWPAKNHGPGNSPDNIMQLYAYCGERPDLEATLREFIQPRYLVKDWKTGGQQGFKNCPAGNGDRALCFGDFVVPANLDGYTPGAQCTFLWYWAFNTPTDLYSTCWEATVNGAGSGTTRPPTTIPGTVRPTTPAPGTTTAPPRPTTTTPPRPTTTTPPRPTTTAPPTGSCNGAPQRNLWEQCGGINYSGSTCCTAEARCQRLNDYYFQCIPANVNSEDFSSETHSSSMKVFTIAGISSFVVVGAVAALVVVLKQRQAKFAASPVAQSVYVQAEAL